MHLSMSVGGFKKREALLKWAVNWQQRGDEDWHKAGHIPVAGVVPVAGRECCEMKSVKWNVNIHILKIFNQR